MQSTSVIPSLEWKYNMASHGKIYNTYYIIEAVTAS